jgi:hypothetical protein
MAIGVKLDFDRTYEFSEISENLREAFFSNEVRGGGAVDLKIEISNEAHELLPNVYNIAFGPLKKNGEIDDKAELSHHDYSNVFSTILTTIWVLTAPIIYGLIITGGSFSATTITLISISRCLASNTMLGFRGLGKRNMETRLILVISFLIPNVSPKRSGGRN